MNKTISIIIPAFNEETSLLSSVLVAQSAINESQNIGEIIIVDDGSTDGTRALALDIQKKYQNISVVSHKVNLGLGAAYKTGVSKSKNEFVMLLPGDDAWELKEVVNILNHVGLADIVIPYIKNAGDKSLFRKVLSKSYTFLVNTIFSLKVPYYNGIVVHKKELLNSMVIRSNDFSYQTEALVKIINKGCSFIAVESNTTKRGGGKSKALRITNIFRVLRSIIYLYLLIVVNAKK